MSTIYRVHPSGKPAKDFIDKEEANRCMRQLYGNGATEDEVKLEVIDQPDKTRQARKKREPKQQPATRNRLLRSADYFLVVRSRDPIRYENREALFRALEECPDHIMIIQGIALKLEHKYTLKRA